MELKPGEKVHFDVMANLFRGFEAVGGKLKITDQRIFFKSHHFNIQTGTLDLPLEQIVEAKARNTMGIIPNGMSVITKDGKEYKFVVWGRGKLIDFININICK
jgi:hypothetical protein